MYDLSVLLIRTAGGHSPCPPHGPPMPRTTLKTHPMLRASSRPADQAVPATAAQVSAMALWRVAGWCLLAVGAAGPAWAQSPVAEAVVLKRATELRQGPSDQSPSVVSLPAQTPLTRNNTRQGAWVTVTTADGQVGWVHLFDVSSASKPSAGNAATGALRGLTGLFGRSAPANQPAVATATVGIRGLSAEDINQAQPNLGALAQVDGWRVSDDQARRFATLASISVKEVAPLPVLKPAPSGGPGAGPRTGSAGDASALPLSDR